MTLRFSLCCSFLLILTFGTTGVAKDITPIATIETSGLVSDFVEEHGLVYVATDAGVVDIVDLTQQKIISQIFFKPILTALGDKVPTRVHSIDHYQGKTLMVTSASNAYRNVWIHDGKRLKKIIGKEKKMMPKFAYFSQKGNIILGTFGSEVILYDTEENYSHYHKQISESTLGGMVLSQDKQKIILSDESGSAFLIDLKSGRVEARFSSEHVDNIYKVDYQNGTILTAGQDRRVGVYRKGHSPYHIKSDFLVYAVGGSPSGDLGLYASGEEHHLQLFETKNGKKGDRLIGHYATPNKIKFVNEHSIISSGDENRLFFWKIVK